MRSLLASLFCSLFLLTAGCGKSDPNTAVHGPYVKFTQYTLGNGLRVILAPDGASTVVSVSVSYDVGSRNERYDQSGLAHLCEHLMFRGSKNVASSEYDDLIQGAGGYSNAGTTKDRTTYYETLPPNQLPLALFLEAARMRSLDISADRIDQVRGEVLAEKRENHDDVPYDGPLEKCEEMVYGKFPYGHPAIGTDLSIGSLTFKDVQQFFKTYYAPSHAAISICGHFDPAQARALVDQYFISIPAGNAAPAVDCSEPFVARRIAPGYVDAPRSAEGLYVRGYSTVSVTEPDFYPLLLAADILGRGQSSRLKRVIVDEMSATSASALISPRRGPSLFAIQIKYPLRLVPEHLARAVDAELLRIVQEGVSQAEVDRACALEQSRLLTELSTTQAQARALSTDAICEGDPGHVNTDVDASRKVTPADIQRVVQKYLTEDRMCEVYSYPGAGHHKASLRPGTLAQAPRPFVPEKDRGIAPVAPQDVVTLPAARVVTCPNGLRIVLVEDHRLPLVTIDALVSAGKMDQPRPGIATMTGQMLAEGTHGMTRNEIYGSLENRGASLSATTDLENTEVTVNGLSGGADEMLTCLSEILCSASFPDDRLVKMRTELADECLDTDFSAKSMFSDLGMQALLGPSPYQQRASRSTDIKAVSRQDVVSFYSRFYRPNRTVMTVAGDFHPDEVVQAITKDFADWKPGEPADRPTPVDNPLGHGSVYLIDWPRNGTSMFDIWCRAPSVHEPDSAAFDVAARILASGPASRLHHVLRDKFSKTYSVTGYEINYQTWSSWDCATAVRADDSAGFYRLLRNEIAGMQSGNVTAQELDRAKRYIIGLVQRSADSPVEAALMAAGPMLRKCGPDYYTQYIAQVRSVTLDDVHHAAKKHLAEDRWIVIAVGPRDYLAGALSPYGHVEILDYTGKRVKP